MTKGLIFYEFPKYMVFLFLLTGMIIEKKKHSISFTYIIYILLLLLGIVFTDIPFNESLRTNIIFNLSGPILLGLCAMYFDGRKMSYEQVLEIFVYLALPMVSMVSYLYFKTPSIEDIVFTANSNYAASGGFGPNQVATILGLGAFVILVLIINKVRISGYLTLDVFIAFYVSYRALLTLSRGGLVTAFLAMSAYIGYYILSKKDRVEYALRFGAIAVIFALSIALYTSAKTGGMLDNRYTNKATDGTVKEDFTTGRVELLISEWENFVNNPFFGIGVGSGKFERYEKMSIMLPTHNEMTRLLGEHGMVGIIIIALLILVPIFKMSREPYRNRAILSAFLIFWFLTINHSAMRLAMPAFVYGLCIMSIRDESDYAHVKL